MTTIIVLLILAGIAISQLTDSGLFEKLKLAKETAKNSQDYENNVLKQYEDTIANGGISGDRSTTYCTTPATTTSTASTTNPCVVIKNYRSGTEWYRVWSDGWIEQGGHSTAGTSETGTKTMLIKEFTDTSYTLNVTITPTTVGDYACSRTVHCKTKNTDGFWTTGCWGGDGHSGFAAWTFDWYACGY